MNDHRVLAIEQSDYKDLPVISSVTQKEMLENYFQIKKDVSTIVLTEMERMLDTPELTDLIINK